MATPQHEPLKQGLAYYNSTISQTPTSHKNYNLPPRADGMSTMSRSGAGSRQGFRQTQDYGNLAEIQSTGSLRAKSRDVDDATSLFNYVSKGGPGSKQGGKSILYRMHGKPKKTLNIMDGSNRYRQTQDVQRFNEDFD